MIRELRGLFPGLSVHRMCVLLDVPRSLAYRKPRPVREDPALLPAVERIVTHHLGYGYRRVRLALLAEGIRVSEHKLRVFLRGQGLLARRSRSRGTTRAGARDRRAPNLVKGLAPHRLDEAWAADTTRIWTESGPLYLAAMLDLCSRKVVGWSLSRRNDEALAADCLLRAIRARRPAAGWICHSDQGSPYTSAGYVRTLREHGARQSLSAPGRPRENAFVESFFRTLKLEEADRARYATFLEAQASLERYIERIYNATRMHSALEYLSPDQHESRMRGEPR